MKYLLEFIIHGSFKSVSGEIYNIFVIFTNIIVNRISPKEKSDNGELNPVPVITLYLINVQNIIEFIVHINFSLHYCSRAA